MIRRWSLFAVVALLLSSVASAGHYDADYYKRTGTKPPAEAAEGYFLLGPTVNYTDKPGVGGVLGYEWENAGITLLGSVSAVQLKGENGSTEFRRFCQTYNVPFSTGNRTQTEYGLTVLFTLRKPK